MPSVSVIIPCFNSSKTIAQCLSAIKSSVFKDYEMIVVDDHSHDDTPVIAAKFADNLIILDQNKGSGNARKIGLENSKADIVCFFDSDIIVKPDTISIIFNFLHSHPDIDAVTGLLSKEHPNRNFCSQYKNLYMNYTFNLLPERVTFLFGSVYAMKKNTTHPDQGNLRYTPDTECGQKLFGRGKTIAFLKNLEVIHLKKYTFLSLIKNDFLVPYSWAKIFIHLKGWGQLGKNNTGFAHSPKTQLASVSIVPLLAVMLAFGFFFPEGFFISCILMTVWLVLNARFFLFLFNEKGIIFVLISIIFTLIDQIVMSAGIMAGFCSQR